eukprot:TRINITY_DN5684_c0_g1_i1.p1 TRINITY_DN5684_c0_g1~~TRINITY_DN5684_c0_g1_i1.p1  ORF type:complete len:1094 (+),score=110.76 TRINITY_DN5684_c0_g1_i1:83-3364(+)
MPTLPGARPKAAAKRMLPTLLPVVILCVILAIGVEATPTPTPTSTRTRTRTNSLTPSKTPTPTESETISASRTRTSTETDTGTDSDTRTHTSTSTPSRSETRTRTATITRSKTSTATRTRSETRSATATSTRTQTITDTSTGSRTRTSTSTPSSTGTRTRTTTHSCTATLTVIPTHTATATATTTRSSTSTRSATATPTNTNTQTPTTTATRTSSATPTYTATPTFTSTDTRTSTLTPSQTLTPTPTGTDTPTPTQTDTPTQTFSQSPSRSPTVSESDTPTQSITPTPTQSDTASRTASLTPSPTIPPSYTSTPTPTDTPSPSHSLTPSRSPTSSPTTTPTTVPTHTPSSTATDTRSSTATCTRSVSHTPTYTLTPTWTLRINTSTPTITPTSTDTKTRSSTTTRSATQTFTATTTRSETYTGTRSPTLTPSSTGTQTVIPTQTMTDTPTQTDTPTSTRTSTRSSTSTRTRSSTPTDTSSSTPTRSATDTPTQTDSSTSTRSATATPTPTLSSTGTSTQTVAQIQILSFFPGLGAVVDPTPQQKTQFALKFDRVIRIGGPARTIHIVEKTQQGAQTNTYSYPMSNYDTLGGLAIHVRGDTLNFTVPAVPNRIYEVTLEDDIVRDAVLTSTAFFIAPKAVWTYATLGIAVEMSDNITVAFDVPRLQYTQARLCSVIQALTMSPPCSSLEVLNVQGHGSIVVTFRFVGLLRGTASVIYDLFRTNWEDSRLEDAVVRYSFGKPIPGTLTFETAGVAQFEDLQAQFYPLLADTPIGLNLTVMAYASIAPGSKFVLTYPADFFVDLNALKLTVQIAGTNTFRQYTKNSGLSQGQYDSQILIDTSVSALPVTVGTGGILVFRFETGFTSPATCDRMSAWLWGLHHYGAGVSGSLVQYIVADSNLDDCRARPTVVGVPDPTVLQSTTYFGFTPTSGVVGETITITVTGLINDPVKVKLARPDRSCTTLAAGSSIATLDSRRRASFVVTDSGTYDVCFMHRTNWELAASSIQINLPVPTQPYFGAASCSTLMGLDGRYCGCFAAPSTSVNSITLPVTVPFTTILNAGSFSVNQGCCITNTAARNGYKISGTANIWGLCAQS